jgi:hypothetical protein
MDRAKTAWRDLLLVTINAPRMNGANTDIRRGWRRFIRKKPQKRNGFGSAMKIPQEMHDTDSQQRNGGTDGAEDSKSISSKNQYDSD